MDRVAAMLILLAILATILLLILAFFSFAPVFCSCIVSLLYTLYLFIANEEAGVHDAQESENRFWTIFATLFSTALFFARDSPIAIGLWSPSVGFSFVIITGFGVHTYDRYLHRLELSREHGLRRGPSAAVALSSLNAMGIPVEQQLKQINSSLAAIDKLLIPSTINNIINQRNIWKKEREIISIFVESDPKALNYLIQHVKLGLLFYKVKDHRNFSGKHRSTLIETLAVTRISALSVLSKVLVLHALQMMKLPAHPRAEYWVRNLILETSQDDLSELKTLTDAKGDYFCMNKLIYDDIRSEGVRQDILRHIKKEAAIQEAHMSMGTKKSKLRRQKAWRKILSDVDDTLYCSGGSYPSGIDKRFGKKVVYPGVLSFYRELDLGIHGPEEWPSNAVGNLVFLSARPHVYKDVSEKHNFAKFEKLRCRGMHTNPSLLAGDLASGTEYILQNDMEPLAVKKHENFKRYVSIYPEFKHIFIGDNGQGDVRAGDLMFQSNPKHLEVLYIHVVKSIAQTHGYSPERWRQQGLDIFFFKNYVEAALNASKRKPPLIRLGGLRRICEDAIRDFHMISSKQWPTVRHRLDRLDDLNQSIWNANKFLSVNEEKPVNLIRYERFWQDGERVSTPYGIAEILSYDDEFDIYTVNIDWRPLDVQVEDHKTRERKKKKQILHNEQSGNESIQSTVLPTVKEVDDSGCDVALNSGGQSLQNPSNGHASKGDGNWRSLETGHRPITYNKLKNESTGELHDETVKVKKGNSALREDFYTKAQIRGRDIKKYSPPKIPDLNEKDRGLYIFSFWGSEVDRVRAKEKQFVIGMECSTPYGRGIIKEFMKDRGIIVVAMREWRAVAYLNQDFVEVTEKGFIGMIGKSLRKLGQTETAGGDKRRNELPFPLGTSIQTPFGEGVIFRSSSSKEYEVFSKPQKAFGKADQVENISTVCLTLTSWTLANNKHPYLYCSVETAQMWKRNRNNNNFLSAFKETIVSSVRKFTSVPASGTESKDLPMEKKQIYHRYFCDGASVSCIFGHGTVITFRELDGMYVVLLTKWTLANNKHPTAFLKRGMLSHRIAEGCSEGYPVLTTYGLTGILASVEPKTGTHVVTIPSAKMVCYLKPDFVERPIKAAVGEDVLTLYGEGEIMKFRKSDGIFRIHMKGWNAYLCATSEAFDRADSSTRGGDGSFGVEWLLRVIFFSSNVSGNKSHTKSQRSRSNSFASISAR